MRVETRYQGEEIATPEIQDLGNLIDELCPGNWDEANPYKMEYKQQPVVNDQFAVVKSPARLEITWVANEAQVMKFVFLKKNEVWHLQDKERVGPLASLSMLKKLLNNIKGLSQERNKVK